MSPPIRRVPVRCLSVHAEYACQNRGVCCSSGWEVAVETKVELSLRPRLLSAKTGLPNGPDGFRPLATPPDGCTSGLRIHPTSRSCWFRDEELGRCAIHREFGEQNLPSACRHFPRVCVIEPDAVSVSLSHYCPTAAGMLFKEGPGLHVVEDPRAFPAAWPFEGLDVRRAYLPFLKPGVLLGFDGLRVFEEEAVSALAVGDVWEGLVRIERAADSLRAWTPRAGPLVDLIPLSFQISSGSPSATVADPSQTLTASLTREAPDTPLLPAFRDATPDVPKAVDLALRRYLAARLIAAWIMFQAEDIAAVVRYLRLCLNTVLLFEADRRRSDPEADRWKEAIRSADLWILHHCDPELLARNLG